MIHVINIDTEVNMIRDIEMYVQYVQTCTDTFYSPHTCIYASIIKLSPYTDYDKFVVPFFNHFHNEILILKEYYYNNQHLLII